MIYREREWGGLLQLIAAMGDKVFTASCINRISIDDEKILQFLIQPDNSLFYSVLIYRQEDGHISFMET